MAIDNLNYYSSGLPAGQQTDKYSSQPGCLKSKNLDIFSSSKSVKATAFSTPTTGDADVIKEEGGLVLKTDGKVYERTALGDTLVVDPSVNFPSYPISYNGKNGDYDGAEWGTPTTMSVKADDTGWKSFVVFTDRAKYTYSNIKFTLEKSIYQIPTGFTLSEGVTANGYEISTNSVNVSGNNIIFIEIKDAAFVSIPLRIYATEPDTTATTISLQSLDIRRESGYYYDPEIDNIQTNGSWYYDHISFTGDIKDGILVNIPVAPQSSNHLLLGVNLRWTRREGQTGSTWEGGKIYLDFNGGPVEDHRMTIGGVLSDGDFNEEYGYLAIANRTLVPVGEYYWMKGQTFQPLYAREYSWTENVTGDKVPIYNFILEYGWENNVSMDIVGIISWNDSFYMIGNMEGNGYIIPCDLSGGRGTPYIAYGCTFKGVENIDYLLYLVGEDRGISTLWVFNQQELVPILGGKNEISKNDIVGVEEEYKFDGKIVNWRKNLILATTDNRIFQYGQTYGGKGGAFIYQVPANATITALKANGNDLEIDYSITVNDTTTNYAVKYQDDTPIKNYNTEWEAVYPIVLGNHLLEKEETDLYASFILPSSTTKLEFWGMANHYHFRTFTSSDNVTLSETESYKIKGTSGTYALKFIERNDNQYTFRLEGDLPLQTTSEKQIIDSNSAVVINYTEFNHFRKIGTIETDKYLEGEFRFTNLNNKLELPKSHSLQIMVKGKGTANYTPELFNIDLVANQRERG